MATFHLSTSELAIFLAILLRLSIIVFMLPIFSNEQVPNQVKVGTIVALTAILFPMLRQTVTPLPFEISTLFPIVMSELIFGIVYSFSVLVIFSAYQMAGELISFEMGFGFAQTADPSGGSQVTLFSVWFELLALLILFSLNGHHIILKSIVESFKVLPIGAFALDSDLYGKIISLSGRLFAIAIKVSAPVVVVLLLSQVGLGLISKFAPQINILATSFPLTIWLGILFMSFSVLIWGGAMEQFLNELLNFLHYLIR